MDDMHRLTLAAKRRRRVTAIIWRFLSIRRNPPLLNGKGRHRESTHYIITTEKYINFVTGGIMKNLDSTSLVPHSLRLLYAAIIDLGHIDMTIYTSSVAIASYTYILGRTAWASWSVDPDVTFTFYVFDWIGISPQRACSLKKANWESCHISSIVHDLFYARFKFSIQNFNSKILK